MKTKLTDLLNIKYPILQGGMAWSSDGNLAAAVSNAGAAGIIGAAGRDALWLCNEIKQAKSMTDKPFGVNLALFAANIEQLLEVVINEQIAFVTIGAGDPTPLIERLHKANIKVIPIVPNLKLAKKVEQKGADAIVIEGMESGGRIGRISTIALMSNVLPHIKKMPVIVAGGISDGRALAAALVMGADGVQMGSRFILSDECPTHIKVKQAIINATDTDSVATGLYTPFATRGLANKFTQEYIALDRSGASIEELGGKIVGSNQKAAIDGDVDNGYVVVGQSLNVLNEILPCKTIVENTINQAKEALQQIEKLKI